MYTGSVRLSRTELEELLRKHLAMERQNEQTIEWWMVQCRELERQRDALLELLKGTEHEEDARAIVANEQSIGEPGAMTFPLDEVKKAGPFFDRDVF